MGLVAVERPDGLLIERLLDAGLHVIAVHPNQVAAMRPRFSAAGGKSDSFDAFVLAELARTDSHRFRVLVPDSDQTKALRALTRAREDLVDTRVALANQLRAQLECFWPGAAAIFADIDSPIALAFLKRYPAPPDARGLGEQRLERFLARHHYCGRRPARELLARLRGAAEGRADTLETEARRQIVLALVAALEPLVAQIAQLTSEIRAALHDHPDGDDLPLAVPRPQDRRSAPPRILAEIGDCRDRYPTKAALAADGGQAARRRRIRQIQARPLPLGLRPPPPRRDRHPRRHQPPPQPLGRRHLRTAPAPAAAATPTPSASSAAPGAASSGASGTTTPPTTPPNTAPSSASSHARVDTGSLMRPSRPRGDADAVPGVVEVGHAVPDPPPVSRSASSSRSPGAHCQLARPTPALELRLPQPSAVHAPTAGGAGAVPASCRPARGLRPPRRRWMRRLAIYLHLMQALYRTRTDDPFLTMEVLYQLS